MRIPPVVLVLVVLLAGCAKSPGGDIKPDSVETAGSGTKAGAPDSILVRSGPGLGVAYDVRCQFGGEAPLKRAPQALVARDHKGIVFRVHAPPTSTGVRLGYRLDEAAIQWLPVAFVEDASWTIPVPPNASEESAPRWSFYYSQDVKQAPQSCYTGATLLQEIIEIKSVANGTA